MLKSGVMSKSTSMLKLTVVSPVFCTPRKYVLPGRSGGVLPPDNVTKPPAEFASRVKSWALAPGRTFWLNSRFTIPPVTLNRLFVAKLAHGGTFTEKYAIQPGGTEVV